MSLWKTRSSRGIPSLQGNDLREVHLNSLRLLKLVNSLLDFARTEGERIEVVREPTNLSQMTENLVESFRTVIEEAGLELIIDCPPSPGARECGPLDLGKDCRESGF